MAARGLVFGFARLPGLLGEPGCAWYNAVRPVLGSVYEQTVPAGHAPAALPRFSVAMTPAHEDPNG